ncbi:hypothetical protein IJD44_01430 [bacterium]|nr:hypothetical protein [bacterium]
MINYIKIIRYMSGESIEEQIDRIIDNGMMNEDTRLFFKKSNCVTCEDISKLVNWFEVINDIDFATDNVVFKPKKNMIIKAKSIMKNKEK